MKFRSEWVTALTLTSLAVYMMTMSKPPLRAVNQRETIAAAGIDRTPVGSSHLSDKRKSGLK